MRRISIVSADSYGAADLIVLAAATTYCVTVRREINRQAQDSGSTQNVWDLVVPLTHDPYLILYLFLPWILILAARDSASWCETAVLTRSRSFVGWLWFVVSGVPRRLGPVAVAWALPIVVSCTGLPIALEWSEFVATPWFEDFFTLSQLGPPWIMAAKNAASISLFMVSLYVVVIACALAGWSLAAWTAAATLWFGAAVNLRFDVPWRSPDLVDGFQTPAVPLTPSSVLLFFLASCWPLLACLAVMLLLDRRAGASFGRHHLSTRDAVYVVVGFVALFLSVRSQTNTSWEGALFHSFQGVTQGGVQFTSYLLMVLVFVGFAYVYAGRLEQELNGFFVFTSVRRGSLLRWWLAHLWPWSVAAGLVPIVALTVVVTLAPGYEGLEAEPGAIPPAGILIYHLLVNGWMQGLVYVLVVFVIRWVARRTVAGLLAVGLCAVLGLPIFGESVRLPLGLNSAGWAAYGWTEVFELSVYLGFTCVVGFCLAIALLISGDARLVEGG